LTKKIDINVDVGEGFGIEQFVLPFVSSVNIACGGHAGSKLIMQETVLLAKQFNVRIGAHPSFEDKKKLWQVNIKYLAIKIKRKYH
jgi:UPF0271 protein